MLRFLLLSAAQNLGESHQRPIELPHSALGQDPYSSFLLFGCEACLSYWSFLSFFFRVEYYEGCIVCVFAYASLVVIHTKELISKDQHCECINHHSYANEKDICMFD
jgi:hypothetical protein